MKAALFFILLIAFPFFAKSQTESFQSLSAQGNELIDNENYKEALLRFEKALQIGTDNQVDLVWTATLAGICAQKTEDLPKAFSLFEIAIKNNCKDEDVYIRGLQIAEQLNDLGKQEKMFLAASQNVEGAYKKYANRLLNFYFHGHQFDKAVDLANELLTTDSGQTQVLKIKGFSLKESGKQNEAIPVFDAILTLDPNELDALMQLGLIYYERGNLIFDKTKVDYNSIKNPTQVNYLEYRNQREKSWVDYRKAVAFLEKAYLIKSDDGLKKALFNAYSRLENPQKANQFR